MEPTSNSWENYKPLRKVMPVIYGVVTVTPITTAFLFLPDTLASDSYATFFQTFVGGSLLLMVVNILLWLDKTNDFRKKYQAIGDAMQRMEPGNTWKQTAASAAMSVVKWQRWF